MNGSSKSWTVADQARVQARMRASFKRAKRGFSRAAGGPRGGTLIERASAGTCGRLVPGETGLRECGKEAAFWYVGRGRVRMFFCEDCARHVPQEYPLQPIREY